MQILFFSIVDVRLGSKYASALALSKGTAIQIGKALINDCQRVSKVS